MGPRRQRETTPIGREKVMAAVLEAASDLFAERGPAATSIRDVAARARINHGLVHRHFGTKEELVGEVLNYLGQQIADQIHESRTQAEIESIVDRQVRVIVRSSLDGYAVGALQKTYPNMELLVDALLSSYPRERDARLAAAHGVALQVGWRLFGDFLRAATGLTDIPDSEIQASLDSVTAHICRPTGERL